MGHSVRDLEDKAFLLLIAVVSLAFAWILWPFYGAILWAIILAIVFAPLHRRLLAFMRQRGNLAALATLLVISGMVILPLTLITASIVQEASGLYESVQSGEFNLGLYLQQVRDALPASASELLDRIGLTNLQAAQERLSAALMRASQFLATQAINIGQGTVDFVISLAVMLYLLFFLLRDGNKLSGLLRDAIPLRAEQQRALFGKFILVIRATVKGVIIVALLQGALGGLVFWFLEVRAAMLWAALMAVLSLLPVVGTALVWVPVAIYFLSAGFLWQGVVLITYGALVIGLVDNIVRPALVGKDTKIPDYVVLISTLGGMATFGINGFVIGPVIAAMFIAVWDIFSAPRQPAQDRGSNH
jgi:predicted PurR-regulated permease PerM